MQREQQILIRYGWQACIGKFSLPGQSDDMLDLAKDRQWQRGARLVIESSRGVETGTSLGICHGDDTTAGRVIRSVQPEDELLNHHLERLSALAHERCIRWLNERGHAAVLLAVEPLLDGQSLYFHFLSGVDELLQQQMDALVGLYEAEVTASDFAQRLIKGCGPGCGTGRASEQSCVSCSNCRACFSQRETLTT